MIWRSLNTSTPVFSLNQFLEAQSPVVYERVLQELRNGRKRSHWMWFIFPQLEGLGSSSISERFALHGLEHARQYANHHVLGSRLRECVQLTLDIQDKTANAIFAFPDDLKFRSSMTLFHLATGEDIFKVRGLLLFW